MTVEGAPPLLLPLVEYLTCELSHAGLRVGAPLLIRSQFTSMDWASFLKPDNLEYSMSRRKNCYEFRMVRAADQTIQGVV